MGQQRTFPSVEEATPEGLVAIGGQLCPDLVLEAYTEGIFPWPYAENSPMSWFSPNPRGILQYKDLHYPRSLIKEFRRNQKHYTITFNEAFSRVIDECSVQKRKNQPGTWITSDIKKVYTELNKLGFAYSLEVWNKEKNLVGGLYGMTIGQMVSGESMFHRESSASKIALLALMEYLATVDVHWIDTQMSTDVVKMMGGTLMSRRDFIFMLKRDVWKTKKEDFMKTSFSFPLFS